MSPELGLLVGGVGIVAGFLARHLERRSPDGSTTAFWLWTSGVIVGVTGVIPFVLTSFDNGLSPCCFLYALGVFIGWASDHDSSSDDDHTYDGLGPT